ncbi:MAG: hypothetical protein P8L78_12785 [Mariniblastus sp.]|nr:hypothetical protein [Mariniblastus sp.]
MSAGLDNSRPTNSAVKGGVGNEFLDRGANRILNTQRRLTVRKTINIGKRISVQGKSEAEVAVSETVNVSFPLSSTP